MNTLERLIHLLIKGLLNNKINDITDNINNIIKNNNFKVKITTEEIMKNIKNITNESLYFFNKLYEDEEWNLFLELYLIPQLLDSPYINNINFKLDDYKEKEEIIIPEGIKRVSIDVGLAFNAPNSALWIEKEENIYVLAFEPNPTNLKYLYRPYNEIKEPANYPYKNAKLRWLNSQYIDKKIKIYPYALSDENGVTDFYCTNNDPGTSSIYKPLRFEIEQKIVVKKRTLNSILYYFPWDKFQYIDILKIDAQGHDFEILLGSITYLERIVYINVEMSAEGQYENVGNKYNLIETFLRSQKFQVIGYVDGNAVFINTNLLEYSKTVKQLFAEE